ncbi:hypothetical protein [Mesoterricola sediminis]|nr:hypothetical protein [Mesoterricola sediminis]
MGLARPPREHHIAPLEEAPVETIAILSLVISILHTVAYIWFNAARH